MIPCTTTSQSVSLHPSANRQVGAVFVDLNSDEQWRDFLQNYAVDTIVVQGIIGYEKSGQRFDKTDEAIALLGAVRPGTKVFMGVVYEASFNANEKSQRELVSATRHDVDVARLFWARLTSNQQQKISGWYLAREIHNFRFDAAGGERKRWVKDYLRVAGDSMPAGLPVLIAPYFVPPVRARADVADAGETARLFSYLLTDTKIRAVLLQDGVGVRNRPDRELGCRWELNAYLQVAAHYGEHLAANLPTGIRLWSTVEMFGEDSSTDEVKRRLSFIPEDRPVIAFAFRQCRDLGICNRRRRVGN